MAKQKTREKLTPLPKMPRQRANTPPGQPLPEPSPAGDAHGIAANLLPLAAPIGELQFDPANARKHAEKSISAIAASLRVYGQLKPVVARRDNKVVVAGNGTLLAALSLNWTHLAVVWVDMDAATAAGFAISDNRTAELSEWDAEALSALLREANTEEDPRLSEMLAELAKEMKLEPAEEASADEEAAPDQSDMLEEKFAVLIQCKDEAEQTALLERFAAEGLSCKSLIV